MVIKAEVNKDLKNKVEETRKRMGLSEAELVRKAVKNFVEPKPEPPLKRLGFY